MATKENLEADFPPLMRQQIDALTEYARAHGRFWREHLHAEWTNATAPPDAPSPAQHPWAPPAQAVQAPALTHDGPDATPLRAFRVSKSDRPAVLAGVTKHTRVGPAFALSLTRRSRDAKTFLTFEQQSVGHRTEARRRCGRAALSVRLLIRKIDVAPTCPTIRPGALTQPPGCLQDEPLRHREAFRPS
jgi:hypothetical protein